MKKWMVAMVFVGLVMGVQARTWTSAGGQTLEAELVRVKDGKVFLKLDANRKIQAFQIYKFSSEDQTYIEEYKQKQADKLKTEALKKRKAKWHESFKKAKAEADEYDLPILLLYTAPEWCGYCVRLEDELLCTKEFKKFADQHLVLLVADYSDKGDGKDWEKDNAAVSRTFKVGGFPCMFFMTKDVQKLGRLGGYDSKLSPEEYISKMTRIINK